MLSISLEVLSAGYEVFSSDPRVMVGKEVLRKIGGEVWSIRITSAKTSDKGDYQCQVCKRVKWINKLR